MFEKKIMGVRLLWVVTGAIVLLALLVVTTIGGCVAYSSAVSASAADVNRARKELDIKFAGQEEILSTLRTWADSSKDKLDQQERSISALRKDVDRLTKRLGVLETDRTRLQAQTMLGKASGKVVRAVIHLSADNPGLAKRDLATAIDALDQAQGLASDDKRHTIAEVRTSLAELRASIEAKAYPIATLEILGDKIDDLVGVW